MKVIIAGGGTGGHFFPAVALAQELLRQNPHAQVLFVGAQTGFEAAWLARHEFSYELLDVSGWRGHTLGERFSAVMKFIRATQVAYGMLRRFGAELVVGAGGYASLPVAAAAVVRRIPLLLMEQNARPGLANRLMSRFAQLICVGFEPASAFFPRRKVRVTGNPVRFTPQSLNLAPKTDSSALRVLVLGGSSGAHRLNLGVLGAFEKIGRQGVCAAIVHQTGTADEELVKQGYTRLGLTAHVTPFIEDIGQELAQADLVISRAGAMAVSEIALFGKAVIFVPYPFHRDRQQELNARVIEREGGAIVLADDEALATNLARELRVLMTDPQRLHEMGRRAAAAACEDAAATIAKLCATLTGEEPVLSRWHRRGRSFRASPR
jgi:UDP-N-acetylglucosamine--N-acetylmuramyl-(pentapeptide) pyrophosphoryl-undecaprenol N-acetylglucosamine transferase